MTTPSNLIADAHKIGVAFGILKVRSMLYRALQNADTDRWPTAAILSEVDKMLEEAEVAAGVRRVP